MVYVGSNQAQGVYYNGTRIWAPFNAATGGSISTFTDSSGVQMRLHQFTNAGTFTFTVTSAPAPFRIAAVAGGYTSQRFSPGARGRTAYTHTATLTPGNYTVKVGGGNGAESGVVNVLTISGGAGGSGDQIPNIFQAGNWQSGGAGGPCCPGGGYPRGGGNSGNSERSPGTFYGAGGGAGEAVDPVTQPGFRGIVGIAYQIA